MHISSPASSAEMLPKKRKAADMASWDQSNLAQEEEGSLSSSTLLPSCRRVPEHEGKAKAVAINRTTTTSSSSNYNTTNNNILISRLLSLPPEMRNTIYRLLLVEPRPIAIQSTTIETFPREPSVLHVCRQIRYEAMPIYYQENRFKVYIVDFDAGLYRRWYTSSGARKHSRKEYVIRDSTNWANLVDWLRAYYYGESSKPGAKRSGKPCTNAALFNLVQRMRKQSLSWEQIERNLEDVHQSLIATDVRWK